MGATLFDSKNFTIDSSSWLVQDTTGIVDGQHVSLKVKVHPEWDVREYVGGVPSAFIGQQLFTYNAALRETQKLGKSLPEDCSALEAIIASMSWDTDIQKYNTYLKKAAVKFSWCFSSWSSVFDDIWRWSYYWLADWNRLALNATTRNVAIRDASMWYMVSLK